MTNRVKTYAAYTLCNVADIGTSIYSLSNSDWTNAEELNVIVKYVIDNMGVVDGLVISGIIGQLIVSIIARHRPNLIGWIIAVQLVNIVVMWVSLVYVGFLSGKL